MNEDEGSGLAERYDRHIRNMLVAIFALGLAAFLDFARDFLLPVVLAFFIALTFRPAIRSMARKGLPEWVSASAFIGAFILICALILFLMIRPTEDFIREAPAYGQTFANKLRQLQGSIQGFLRFAERIQQVAIPSNAPAAQEVVIKEGPPLAYIGQITGYSLSIIATLVLSLVTAAFLMASGDLFYAKLVRVLPTLKDKKTALRIVYDVEREVSSYLLIVTAINAALGIAVAISFFFLGMPTPHVWGFVAFALNFIPYVGAIAGMSLATFIAIVTFDSTLYALLVPLTYAFWNGMENQFVTPYFLGRRLQLNSVSILLALAFWTWLWGIAGTMIAVPVLVTIKIFCDHLESLSGIGEFLSEKYPDDHPTTGEATSGETAHPTSGSAAGKK